MLSVPYSQGRLLQQYLKGGGSVASFTFSPLFSGSVTATVPYPVAVTSATYLSVPYSQGRLLQQNRIDPPEPCSPELSVPYSQGRLLQRYYYHYPESY